MPVQLEVTTENLLSAVAKMPDGEFDRFVERAKKLRTKAAKVSGKEVDLLHKINTIFPTNKRIRYNELYAKFKEGDLTPKEYNEVTKLSDEFEMLNVKRLELVAEIAKMRNQPFAKVFKDLGLKPQK